MIHFLYLLAFALFASVCFSLYSEGTTRERLIYGSKMFLQFVLISLAIAWVLYFIPF